MKKIINVRNGQIALNVPEDVSELYVMLNNISEKTMESAKIISQKNEEKIDHDLRKYSAAEFERFFGEGTCVKTFGTKYPSYKAFVEFSEKICNLVKTWI